MLQHRRPKAVDGGELAGRRHEVERGSDVREPQRELVVEVAALRAPLCIGAAQQVEQHARARQLLGRVAEQLQLAGGHVGHHQRGLQQRPDDVEVRVELAVGAAAVGSEHAADDVGGFVCNIGKEADRGLVAERGQLLADLCAERADRVGQQRRSSHRSACCCLPSTGRRLMACEPNGAMVARRWRGSSVGAIRSGSRFLL